MSLSTLDFQTLENVSKLTAFFDVIQNPEKISVLVKDAKKVLESLEAIAGPYNTVETANQFLKESKLNIAELENKHNKKVEEFQDFIAKTKEKYNLQKQELDKKAKDLDVLSKELTIQEKDIADKKVAFEKEVAISLAFKKELEIKQAEILNREKELAEKAEKIKQLLGE